LPKFKLSSQNFCLEFNNSTEDLNPTPIIDQFMQIFYNIQVFWLSLSFSKGFMVFISSLTNISEMIVQNLHIYFLFVSKGVGNCRFKATRVFGLYWFHHCDAGCILNYCFWDFIIKLFAFCLIVVMYSWFPWHKQDTN